MSSFRWQRCTSCILPGSTSTKISLYEGEQERFTQELQHSVQELQPFAAQPVTAQFGFRKDAILAFLAHHGVTVASLDAVKNHP